MSTDAQTLAVYDCEAEAYETRVASKDLPGLSAFLSELPEGGKVLDLGCGPGLAAQRMMQAGLDVDAIDGSQEMVARARAHGVPARKAMFHEITGIDEYDGIWANFSLLHLPRNALPGTLQILRQALKPGGVFHIGMKLGKGSGRDRLGRFYTYYSADELDMFLTNAGFTPGSHLPGSGRGLEGSVSEWMVLLSYG
ncbi:class I SAM-dependent DNA methyltransferase [Aliiroseovarius marinus]|uniref:class I SAM-dependent DNA methyltransferase n=1 Tax=Aliiroseovarius marinus TaxID=2500159 RepID=UPI003D7C7FB8